MDTNIVMIDIESENMNQTQTVINGLGTRLKRAREAMSLTTKEAAAHLHLNANIIDIIEKEQFADGPPLTFMRGYLRSYARLLNVPEHEISHTLKELEITIPNKNRPLPALNTRPIPQTDRYLHWTTYLIVLTMVILVALWWHSHQRYIITDVPTKTNPILPAAVTPAATPDMHQPTTRTTQQAISDKPTAQVERTDTTANQVERTDTTANPSDANTHISNNKPVAMPSNEMDQSTTADTKKTITTRMPTAKKQPHASSASRAAMTPSVTPGSAPSVTPATADSSAVMSSGTAGPPSVIAGSSAGTPSGTNGSSAVTASGIDASSSVTTSKTAGSSDVTPSGAARSSAVSSSGAAVTPSGAAGLSAVSSSGATVTPSGTAGSPAVSPSRVAVTPSGTAGSSAVSSSGVAVTPSGTAGSSAVSPSGAAVTPSGTAGSPAVSPSGAAGSSAAVPSAVTTHPTVSTPHALPPQIDTPPIISATSSPIEGASTSTAANETSAPTSVKHIHKHKPVTRHATLPGMPGINMALPEPN
jgi:cytoskeleton protein RodZ